MSLESPSGFPASVSLYEINTVVWLQIGSGFWVLVGSGFWVNPELETRNAPSDNERNPRTQNPEPRTY